MMLNEKYLELQHPKLITQLNGLCYLPFTDLKGIIGQWPSAFSETKGSEWEPNLLAILWGPYALENEKCPKGNFLGGTQVLGGI